MTTVHRSMYFPTFSAVARWLGLVWILGGLAGCAAVPPVQEMSDARQAIAAAKEAGAAQLAVDQLSEAEHLLQNAEAFLIGGTTNAYWHARKAAVGAKEMAFEALLTSRNAKTPPSE